MSENYSFFGSKNHDRVYKSHHWADYFRPFFKTGVFNGDLQVAANNDMSVTINPGYAWIDGYMYHLTAPLSIDLEIASGNANRVDNIVIRFDLTNRWIKAYAVTGGYYSKAATPPVPQITSTIHEIVIARVDVAAGTTSIKQEMIEDTRMDDTVCGWVCGTVQQIKFEQIYAQFKAFQESKEAELAEKVNSYEAWEVEFKDTQETTFETLKSDCSQEIVEFLEQSKTEFNSWFTSNTNNWEEDWLAFFNNIKEQLSDEPATHLQQQIGNLNELETEEKDSLVDAVNELHQDVDPIIPIVNKFIRATYKKTTSANPNLVLECTFEELEAMVGVGIIVEATNSYNTATYVSISSLTVEDSTGEKRTAKLGCPYIGEPNASTYVGYNFSDSYINFNTFNLFSYAGPHTNSASYPAGKFVNLTSIRLFISTTSAYKISSSMLFTGGGAYNMYQELLQSHQELKQELQQCLKCVEEGQFTNDTITIDLKYDATYLLATREITLSTGKVYGYRARLYATPKERETIEDMIILNGFNNTTVAASAANLAASSNAGVTLGTVTPGSNYGISLKATATYQVSYALYELANSYGDYF